MFQEKRALVLLFHMKVIEQKDPADFVLLISGFAADGLTLATLSLVPDAPNHGEFCQLPVKEPRKLINSTEH